MLNNRQLTYLKNRYEDINTQLKEQFNNILEDQKITHKIKYQTRIERNRAVYEIDPIVIYEASVNSPIEPIDEILYLTEFIKEQYIIEFHKYWYDSEIKCTIQPLVDKIDAYKNCDHISLTLNTNDSIIIDKLVFIYDTNLDYQEDVDALDAEFNEVFDQMFISFMRLVGKI